MMNNSNNRPSGKQYNNNPRQPGGSQLPQRKFWLIILLILAVNYLATQWFLPGDNKAITVPYTTFKEQVA